MVRAVVYVVCSLARGRLRRGGVPGPIWNRPLHRSAIIQGPQFSEWRRAPPPVVGAGFIPPAGVRAAAGFPGRCKHRPLQRFVIAQGCAFPVGRGTSRRRKPGRYGIGPYRGLRCCAVCGFPGGRASPPVCRGGPWPSRGCPRRRNFPVRHRGFPGSVGRAFTPAAPWRFQKSGPCVAAGFGGMGASRPTAARVVAGSHLGRAFAPVRGVRRFMPRPGGRRPRGRACRRCTAASGAGRGGRAGRRRGTGRQRTTR